MFDWNNYKIIADELYEKSKECNDMSEAYLRVAISRIYYSAFILTRDKLISFGFKYKQDGIDHTDVRNDVENYFKESRTKSRDMVKDLKQDLFALSEKRKTADYTTNETMSSIPDLYLKSNVEYNSIIDTLNNLSKEDFYPKR